MKNATAAWGIVLFIFWTGEVALGASREQKIVTRVDAAAVQLKHRTLVIKAVGMGRTPSAMGRAGRLVRRGGPGVLNKDGLLEYNLIFNGIPNYSGFNLKPVTASLKERSVPQGIKGVRVFGEFNQVDAFIPEPKKRKLSPFGKKRKNNTSDETSGSVTGGSPHP
jgi:hypothetical protein